MSLLLIAALLLCYCRKRQNKQELDHMKQVRSYVVQPSPRSASLTITNAKTLVSYKMTSVKLRQQEHAYFHEKETARNSATHSDLLPYSTVAEASSFQEHPQEQDLERRIEDTKSALETISRSMTSSDVGRRRKWQRRNTPGLSEAAETATLRQQIVELQAELEQMRRQREHLQVIDMIREREALPSYSESVRA
jgi:tRNA C32,U32 (ribose-2'-O)-methylase TrmJ